MLEPSGLGSLRFQNSSRKTTNGAVYIWGKETRLSSSSFPVGRNPILAFSLFLSYSNNGVLG
ncbi:hypothetical protein HID58_045744 [Brassica napus]|uniref:Uncharacterized protein n=1 Tax=Brassica napus TaxID=3708 RepID=A0ABQ8AUH4_BRANA|nr:hypothetical protein HID58_045744 [Brassica napus]